MIFVLGFICSAAALALIRFGPEPGWRESGGIPEKLALLVLIAFFTGLALMLWSIGTLAWRYLP